MFQEFIERHIKIAKDCIKSEDKKIVLAKNSPEKLRRDRRIQRNKGKLEILRAFTKKVGLNMPDLRVSSDQDLRCLQVLDNLRKGEIVNAERILNEIDHMYTYAAAAPSKRGFSNLLHCFRRLTESHRRNSPNDEKSLPFLVAKEESDRYDPDTQTVVPYLPPEEMIKNDWESRYHALVAKVEKAVEGNWMNTEVRADLEEEVRNVYRS